jgi:RNA polymerase sigma-70 factor (ECF subfamily)
MLSPLTGEDITRLYDLHAEAMLAFLVRRTFAPDVAVDLMAETFAVAFEDRSQFRGRDERAARAWLYAIARHQLTDYFRRGQVEARALARLGVERRPMSDAEYERIEELAASRELRATVADNLASLPADQREVLRLRVVEERPYGELALSLGISEQTARARVSRALRALRGSRTLAELREAPDHA